MSPIMLQQQLNLSRRACCYRRPNSTAYCSSCSCNSFVPGEEVQPLPRRFGLRGRGSKCYRSGFSWSDSYVLLVLLGVLLCSFPAPSWGRPNGTAGTGLFSPSDAVKESQPNVSRLIYNIVCVGYFLDGNQILSGC